MASIGMIGGTSAARGARIFASRTSIDPGQEGAGSFAQLLIANDPFGEGARVRRIGQIEVRHGGVEPRLDEHAIGRDDLLFTARDLTGLPIGGCLGGCETPGSGG